MNGFNKTFKPNKLSSVPSSWSGTVTALLLHWSAHRSHAPTYPNSWLRNQDAWSPIFQSESHNFQFENPNLGYVGADPQSHRCTLTWKPPKLWRLQHDESIRKTSRREQRYHPKAAKLDTLCPPTEHWEPVWILHTGSETRDSPSGVQHSLGTILTHCWECKRAFTLVV